MDARKIVTAVLLVFIGASVAVLAVKQFRQDGGQANPPAQTTAANTPSTDAKPANVSTPPEAKPSDAKPADAKPSRSTGNKLIAYYFHGKQRCPTCKNIEAYTQEAVASGFDEQLAAGRIEWQVVDYDEPANQHFKKDFELDTPSVVLVRLRDGKQQNWRNLPEVWELVGDKPAFIEFVQRQIRQFMAPAEKG